MAGGSTTKVSPWQDQKPYLQRGFQRAEDLYQQQPYGTSYFGGPTVAGFDPAQEAAQGGVLGYAGGPRPGVMQAGTETALMKGLAGGAGVNYGAGSPFSQMMNVAGRDVTRNLTGTVLPGIREGLVMHQPGGSSVGNLMQQKAVNAAASTLADRAAEMYGGAYGAAEAAIPQYMQQSAGVQQTPLSMYQSMADVGADRRAMTQEGINQQMARHAWGQNAPQRALQNYLASVTGDYGAVIRQENEPNILGALGSAIGGGLLGGSPFG